MNFSILLSKDSSSKSRNAPKPRVNDGLKMRASVRMTRYLESWGAVKPFAHLKHQDGFSTDSIVSGKPHHRVSIFFFFFQWLRQLLLKSFYMYESVYKAFFVEVVMAYISDNVTI